MADVPEDLSVLDDAALDALWYEASDDAGRAKEAQRRVTQEIRDRGREPGDPEDRSLRDVSPPEVAMAALAATLGYTPEQARELLANVPEPEPVAQVASVEGLDASGEVTQGEPVAATPEG